MIPKSVSVSTRIVVLAAVLLIPACQSAPWYAKMADKNPQCVELVKHMTCQDFVESSQRVNVGLVHILSRDDIPAQSRAGLQVMLDIGEENIRDVTPCPD